MKVTYNRRHHSARRPQRRHYPNAADSGYFEGKLLDIVTAVVSGAGLMTAMFYLILM